MNLVHLNSKKGHFTYFLQTNTTFHHISNINKKWCDYFVNVVAVKYTLYLARSLGFKILLEKQENLNVQEMAINIFFLSIIRHQFVDQKHIHLLMLSAMKTPQGLNSLVKKNVILKPNNC